MFVHFADRRPSAKTQIRVKSQGKLERSLATVIQSRFWDIIIQVLLWQLTANVEITYGLGPNSTRAILL